MLRRPKWRREDLVVPKVMDDFVTKRVLAMEFIPGAKVTDWAAKETKPEKRKEVMAKLIDFYGAEVRRFEFRMSLQGVLLSFELLESRIRWETARLYSPRSHLQLRPASGQHLGG